MLRQCLLVSLLCSFVVSIISASTPAAAPRKDAKLEDVKFKTAFPYDDGSQFYGPSPCDSQYGYPQSGNCGNGWPYGGQYGPVVSYPSYGLPQQPYNPYPYTSYNSYQPYQTYQPIPYNTYPQYGTGGYQYPLSTGYPTSSYPLGADSVSYTPINSATPDILKLLGSPNVVTTIEDTNDTYPVVPVNSQQPLSTVYLPQSGFGNNGAPSGNYPLNRYDPFSNVPTEIIDVDYTPGFKASQPNDVFQYPKPVVKVTSSSKQSGVSAQPIVKTQSSVVTMKPLHAVITRVYDSSKGENPTVKVEDLSNDLRVNELTGDDQKETNDITQEDDVKGKDEEDEKPADVSSWFK